MVRWILVLLMPLVLLGCSDNDNVLPPSPLPYFKSQLNVEKLWTVRVGEGVGNEYLSLKPAVTERWVFAASAQGLLLKIDRATGKKVWRVDFERPISGGVSAGYGVVGLGTANGEVLIIDENDGHILWEKPLAGQIMSSPALSDDRVVVQTLDGRLHGLNRIDGSIVWVYDTSIPILTLRGESSPVVIGGATLAGFANGKLAALDTSTGYVAWENPVGESQGRSDLERLTDLDGRFVVSGKTAFAVTYQGNLAAIDVPSGRLLWKRKLSSYAGVGEYLNQLYVVDQDSALIALDSVSGSDIWQQDRLKGRRLSAPTAYDRYVLVGDFEGYLYWLSYKDGEFLSRVKVGVRSYEHAPTKAASLRTVYDPTDGLRVEPVVYDDVVYVQGNRGELSAFRVIEKP